jgi:hypothetical protein
MRSFKAIQPLFFFVTFAIVCYFSFLFANNFWDYFSLSQQGKATVFQWEIIQKGEKYPIQASYSFSVGKQKYKNSFIFKKPWSWNELSALALLKEKAKKEWTVFYNPNNPSQSSLENSFPYSILFRTLICYTVFVYFILFRMKFFNLH